MKKLILTTALFFLWVTVGMAASANTYTINTDPDATAGKDFLIGINDSDATWTLNRFAMPQLIALFLASPTLTGDVTIGSGGDAADAGAIRFKNGDAICFEDGIEDCLTHVNDFGLVVNRDFSGGVPTVTDVDGFTMTAAQGRGYVIYATGAGTIVMNPVLPGDQFTVECHSAAAVVLNPDASGTEDTIRLDGVALSIGDSITNDSAAGDVAVCTYYAADTWSCITNGWTDTN
jgi:hypothetical protein